MKTLFLFLFFLISESTFAQNVEFSEQVESMARQPPWSERVVIQCSSQDYQTRRCPAGGVILHLRLLRQFSDAPCIAGETYGNDRRNVIVTRGCRGQFEVLIRRNNNNDNETVYCASEDYHFNSCYVGRYVRDVYLIRQESDSVCREGFSWGFDRDRIWVDRGCRGYFRVLRY